MATLRPADPAAEAMQMEENLVVQAHLSLPTSLTFLRLLKSFFFIAIAKAFQQLSEF